jgi:hypothetical protein
MTASRFPVARTAKGVTIQITTEQRQFEGELIEVRDDGLLMLVEQKLRFVPYGSVDSSLVYNTKLGRDLRGRRAPNALARDRLRLISRHPQGLSPELLRQLLAVYGQTEIDRSFAPQDQSKCLDIAAFIECARNATAKYRNQEAAVVDGYRRIGGDFPAMGEHWIKIGLLFDGELDPNHPEVLNYVVVGGKPELAGVAYALALLQDESPPDWPVAHEGWHDHSRSLEDETILPHHNAAGHDGTPRLSMLHVWLWLDNPEGTFAADNWAIPYFRLQRRVPAPFSVDAAKALALVAAGSSHITASVEAAVSSEAARSTVRAAITRAQDTVESMRVRNTLDDTDRLSNVWRQMCESIDRASGSRSALCERVP